MRRNQRVMRVRCRAARRGIAAVEAAVVLPLLVALILGTVDLGQFANCHQKVSDACREGARYAAQFEAVNTSEVEAVVLACLGDMFPTVPASTLQSNTTVTVRNGLGATVTGTALGSTATGSPISVEVTLQYEAVRWISGPQFCSNIVQVNTVMRRE
jgi:Flp pilus assembly protein TadG